MITTARPLPLKAILSNKRANNHKTVWCGNDQEELLTHKSWVSLLLVMKWFARNNERKPIVYVPKFYCFDTLYQFQEEAKFVYYDICEDFLPDYKQCTLMAQDQKPDIFIFVHYFGIYLDANNAKVFCRNKGVFLIEDAAHVLWGNGKIGKHGDFILYSPWKSTGLPDGAVLLVNSKGPSDLDARTTQRQLEVLNDANTVYSPKLISRWKIKKILQKFLPNRNNGLKMNDISYKREFCSRISNYSRNKLLGFTVKDVLTLGDKKRINAMLLEYYLISEFDVEPIRNNGYPYAETIKAEDDYERIWVKMSRFGQVAFTWPNLNLSLNEMARAEALKKELLHIAVHDGLNPNVIYRKLRNGREKVCYSHLQLEQIGREEYDVLCGEAEAPLPLLQSIAYAEAKANAQGWHPSYWLIKNGKLTVAFFLILTKHRLIHRINRGPYLIDPAQKDATYQLIRNQFGRKGSVLFWAPEIEQTGINMNGMLNIGCKFRNVYFSTGYLDLRLEEDVLRKNMDSKWRNQLKACEKLKLPVFYADNEEIFYELLEKHTIDKEKRNYRDSGDYITEQLFKSGNLRVFYVKGDDESVISIVMLAVYKRTATYYIGWSSKTGYQKNANRYLLWEAVKKIKQEGCEWFDLGGIDLINTRNIAEFKLGVGCCYKNLVGEYYSF